MSRVRALIPSELDAAQRDLYDLITRGPRNSARLVDENGALRGPFDPMLRSPAVGEPLQALGAAIRFSSSLPAAMREVAILVAAVECRCQFEWDAHLPIAEAEGLDRGQLESLRRAPSTLRGLASLVERCARALSRERRLESDDFDHLVDAFGLGGSFELIVTVGYYSTLAMVMNSFDIG